MNPRVFQELRALIHRESGIYLSDEKESLLTNRLTRRLRATGATSEEEYLSLLELDTNGQELVQLIDAISTNVTHFFRESDHFTRLQSILEQLRTSKQQEVKIWCAASSTGEEPYTLAMTADQVFGDSQVNWRILATDISTKVLELARLGCYSDEQIAKLPPDLCRKYFEDTGTGEHNHWQVRGRIRERVAFRKLNLSRFPYPLKGSIDVIFCRNVMIYFDTALRQRIINEHERLLVPGGYLFLSHSENLLSVTTSMIAERGSVYRKRKSESEGGKK